MMPKEISQTAKDKYCMVSLTCEILFHFLFFVALGPHCMWWLSLVTT